MSKLTLGLPNGKTCYLTSALMRPTAKYMRWEIFKKKRYVHPGFELRPTDTVLDIGGNIGMFALWAAPQVPQGKIVSVEPNPTSLECFKLNVERNSLTNVTPVHAAAGPDGGTMELLYHPGWEPLAYSSNVKPPWFYANSHAARFVRWLLHRTLVGGGHSRAIQRITAPQMSLGRIMRDHRMDVVNYLKLDCEGSEFEILRHVEPVDWARIERVAIEYHEYGPGRKVGELMKILQDNGFEVELDRSFLDKVFGPLGASFGEIWARRRGLPA